MGKQKMKRVSAYRELEIGQGKLNPDATKKNQ
jgi:hypothetical protein